MYEADQAFSAVTVNICAGRVVSTSSKRCSPGEMQVLGEHAWGEQQTSQVKHMQGKETVIYAVPEIYNAGVYKLN